MFRKGTKSLGSQGLWFALILGWSIGGCVSPGEGDCTLDPRPIEIPSGSSCPDATFAADEGSGVANDVPVAGSPAGEGPLASSDPLDVGEATSGAGASGGAGNALDSGNPAGSGMGGAFAPGLADAGAPQADAGDAGLSQGSGLDAGTGDASTGGGQ